MRRAVDGRELDNRPAFAPQLAVSQVQACCTFEVDHHPRFDEEKCDDDAQDEASHDHVGRVRVEGHVDDFLVLESLPSASAQVQVHHAHDELDDLRALGEVGSYYEPPVVLCQVFSCYFHL